MTRQTASHSRPQSKTRRPAGGPLTRHLRSVDESYLQHCAHALRFAATLTVAAVCCLIHALLPFLFEKTGSRLVERLHRDMVLQRERQSLRAADARRTEPGEDRSAVCS